MTETNGFPWNTLDAAGWLRTWQQVWRMAPETLVQPILPGWTLNINSNNSSSPQTEVDVLARHSYGRQIGRIADALEALLDKAAPGDKRFGEFLKMKREVDEVKKAAAGQRVDQVIKDVSLVKNAKGPEYQRLRSALRDLLKD